MELYILSLTELITNADGSRGGRGKLFTRICLSVVHMTFQKPIQLGLRNLTVKCSTMSPGNRFIWGQKDKCQGHDAQKTVPAWVLFALL